MSCLAYTQCYFPPTPLPKLFSIQPTGIVYFSIGHVFWIANDSLRISDAKTQEHPCVVIDLETIGGKLTGYVAVLSSKETGQNTCIAIDTPTVHGVRVSNWKPDHFVTSVNQFTIATIAPSKYRYLGMITPASLATVENACFGRTIKGMSNQLPMFSDLMENRKTQWQQERKRAEDAFYQANRERKAQPPTFNTSNPFSFLSISESSSDSE